MPIEIKGQQLRIRKKAVVKGAVVRTVDPGRRGFTQIIVQRRPGRKTTETQSIRFNLKDFKTPGSAKSRVRSVRTPKGFRISEISRTKGGVTIFFAKKTIAKRKRKNR